MNTSNLIMLDPPKSRPVQSSRSSLPCSWTRCWRGLLLSAAFLLMACGSAMSQQVTMVGYTNDYFTVSGGIGSVSGINVPAGVNCVVVGVYTDNNPCDYSGTTFGGVAPDGFINAGSGVTRMGCFYWLNPNTSVAQTLNVVNTASNPGAYIILFLSGVDTTKPVVTTGPLAFAGAVTNLTTTVSNSFITSFYSLNQGGQTLVPDAPFGLVTNLAGVVGGGDIAAGTNTVAVPGGVTNSWTPTGQPVEGLAAFAFAGTIPGSPQVVASASPSSAAPNYTFKVTATVTPGYGSVTNVSVESEPPRRLCGEQLEAIRQSQCLDQYAHCSQYLSLRHHKSAGNGNAGSGAASRG